MRSALLAALVAVLPALAVDRPGTTFKVFQFPPDRIPRVDGNADDWKMVPDDYAVGMEEILDGRAFAEEFRVRGNLKRDAGLPRINRERAF